VTVADDPTTDLATHVTALLDSAHVVIDAGTRTLVLAGAEHVLVVRNCYLALRRVVSSPPADRIALVVEPQRSLGVRDVVEVLGHPTLVEIAHDATTRSKRSPSTGANMSPVRASIVTALSAAFRRVNIAARGLRSAATTSAPRSAATTPSIPAPQHRSRTRPDDGNSAAEAMRCALG
jgi:hypothetical protein